MTQAFNIIEQAQHSYLKIHQGLSIEQLNNIPEGFKNNLVWNYAHIVSSLQMLCYGRSGLALRVNDTFVQAYKVGTKPEGFVDETTYATYQTYAAESLAKLKEDYASGYFAQFKPFTTSTGFEINDIETAIMYVVQHHGMHLGYSMAIKKLVL
jgi:hypothetical protein